MLDFLIGNKERDTIRFFRAELRYHEAWARAARSQTYMSDARVC